MSDFNQLPRRDRTKRYPWLFCTLWGIVADNVFFLSRLWLGHIVIILSTCRMLGHFYTVHSAIGFPPRQAEQNEHSKKLSS